jgi:hypothetical protein
MHHTIISRTSLDSNRCPTWSLVLREQAGPVLVRAHALSVILVETVSFLARSAALKASVCIQTAFNGTLPRMSFAVSSQGASSGLGYSPYMAPLCLSDDTVPPALFWVGRTMSKSWIGSLLECKRQCPRSNSARSTGLFAPAQLIGAREGLWEQGR